MSWIQLVTVILCANAVIPKDIWYKPGCHKVGKFLKFLLNCGVCVFKISPFIYLGHTRKIEIPDCVQFTITTNACRGFCESYAVPSAPATAGISRPPKPVTSVGQCCNIMESEDVNVHVSCVGGPKNLTFKSATKCSCYHCKKD